MKSVEKKCRLFHIVRLITYFRWDQGMCNLTPHTHTIHFSQKNYGILHERNSFGLILRGIPLNNEQITLAVQMETFSKFLWGMLAVKNYRVPA